ncbi:hypothetical protein [Actinoplanes sp. NPDC026619]|uniref:hypothetical protein n=1 Tax=Actinoplanes sp. NPDC026619 TaxID=3155798 RepID=UPI0033E871C9
MSRYNLQEWRCPDSDSPDAQGRLVQVTSDKNQYVRIGTLTGGPDRWEQEFRLPAGGHVSITEAKKQHSLTELIDWLNSNGAVPAKANPRPTLVRELPEPGWMAEAKAAVESGLDSLIDDFLEDPFRHRVEHSLHVLLYERLAATGGFSKLCPIGDTQYRTTMLHKEWPETTPRPEKSGRGNFDLAIIAPNQLEQTKLPQFVGGHVEAAIVIEVGLNYGHNHLKNDYNKLDAAKVVAGYILDLHRIGQPNPMSVSLARKSGPSIHVAYAHYLRGREPVYKYVRGDFVGL